MSTKNRIYRILGIDPGSVITGYGIIDTNGSDSEIVEYGAIRTGNGTFTERLAVIAQQLTEQIALWKPHEAAIEDVFLSNNAASALKLGQARGVAIAACTLQGLSVAEYATRLVKQNVVGTGGASKRQVQNMLTHMLHVKKSLQADAADALAVAVCHAHCKNALLQQPATRAKKRTMRFDESILNNQYKA